MPASEPVPETTNDVVLKELQETRQLVQQLSELVQQLKGLVEEVTKQLPPPQGE